ncbi:MAG: non-homologous end-joining DNA ligase [Actinomycetota bacterium]|nr:non-homologous end-joining DNA ligase [Actinomycetota bacterium]
MTGKLDTYRRKRDPKRTPEPVPATDDATPKGNDSTFVIQEHHARALHWDFRLERDGVLVSWAVPKGLPLDPKTNHLAVQTEDHPLEYATFDGDIPEGEYGGGKVILWDRGTYECEKWTDREVKVVLHGNRVSGRYVLFRTSGKNWMIHRMDPPPRPDWQPLPTLIKAMLATLGTLPPPEEDDQWGYEMKWDGVRAVVYVEGGRVRAMTRNDRDVTGSYPELRKLGETMGATQAVLDGELVTFDDDGRPSFGRLQQRMHVTNAAQVRRLAETVPVIYLIFDLLHLDGRSTIDLPYEQRREILDGLGLAGLSWQTPQYFRGGGEAIMQASKDQQLEGIMAKLLSSVYLPGKRTDKWRKVKNHLAQEVVIVGWKPGKGRREGRIGSLLLAIPAPDGLTYAGHVGTGFTDAMLDDLAKRLKPLQRRTPPVVGTIPRPIARDAHWVTPKLVGEVEFAEWTGDGKLRHPSWRGLRPDKSPEEVTRES